MELDAEIRKFVLENAIKYEGKPSVKSVMSAIMGSRQDLRKKAAEVKALVLKMVKEVSALSLEEQKSQLAKIAPELLQEATISESADKELPDLPNTDSWSKIVMRLAPFPSGPLHIGNARMVLLNDFYVKKYNGELILVFDDTIGSAEKVLETDAYDLIPEGLEYLNVEWHRTVYKSDRLELFYEYAVDLIKKKEAYVCDCDANTWRKEHKNKKKACACRTLTIEQNLARWEKMLDGSYPERAAAVRLKTGMDDPDPAMRDHVILRISESEHPRIGTKYRVWPLLEYSWGIDDHELGVSHIIRGKDLVKEGKIEQHIWNLYGWQNPELIYYGRLKFQDAKLSKSKSRREVVEGVYSGWDDPRTWSLQSLQKRGIHPDAIRKVLLDLGLSIVDIAISMKPVYAENRKLRDASANRYFYVQSPVWLTHQGLPPEIKTAESLVHPDFPERGKRIIPISKEIAIEERDYKRIKDGSIFRLKDLANFILRKGENPSCDFHSFEVDIIRDKGGSIIHWVPKDESVPLELITLDGEVLVNGICEPSINNAKLNQFIQFERVGFVKIFQTTPILRASFAHK